MSVGDIASQTSVIFVVLVSSSGYVGCLSLGLRACLSLGLRACLVMALSGGHDKDCDLTFNS